MTRYWYVHSEAMRRAVDNYILLRLREFSTKTGVVSIIVTALLVVLFARLGLWQLDRAEEKRSMLAAKELASTAAALTALGERTFIQDIEYRNVELSGSYDYSRQFLLDNRIYKQQAGYEVITPFYPLDTDGFILVNRGWVGHNGNRNDKPVIPFATTDQLVKGVMTNPSKGFSIGPAIEDVEVFQNEDPVVAHNEGQRSEGRVVKRAELRKQNWPLMLQYIDYATIADKVDKIPLVRGVVVADQGQNGSLIYNWQPVANGPEKHYGYAFQWFAMLFAVIFLFIYLNFIKKANE